MTLPQAKVAPDWRPPILTMQSRRPHLLSQADLALDQQHVFFSALETKAGQYLTVASIGLAAAVVFVPDDHGSRLGLAPSWLFALVVGSILFVAVSGLIVLGCALMALRIQNVSRRPTNARVVFDTFQSPAEDFDEMYAARLLEAADELCEVNGRKAEWLETTLHGLYFLVLALMLMAAASAVLSSASFPPSRQPASTTSSSGASR